MGKEWKKWAGEERVRKLRRGGERERSRGRRGEEGKGEKKVNIGATYSEIGKEK